MLILFSIATAGVPGWIVGQESKDKQGHEGKDDDINNDFQS